MGSWAGCVLASKAIDLDRDRIRKLRGETVLEFVAKFERPRRFRVSNMYQKKKARRARGLGSDPGLDLAIPRSSNSLECPCAVNLAEHYEINP